MVQSMCLVTRPSRLFGDGKNDLTGSVGPFSSSLHLSTPTSNPSVGPNPFEELAYLPRGHPRLINLYQGVAAAVLYNVEGYLSPPDIQLSSEE